MSNICNQKKTVYLHLGTNKTGTTTIQRFMSDNYEALMNNGLLYPQELRKNNNGNREIAHHYFSYLFYPEGKGPLKFSVTERDAILSSLYEQYVQEVSETACGEILISSEAFPVNLKNTDVLYRMRDFFKDSIVKIVLYIRRQDEYAVSRYYQHMKGKGVYSTFKEHINNFNSNDRTHYLKFLDYCATVFGEENIIVRRFGSKYFLHGDLISDFLGVLNKECCGKYKKVDVSNTALPRDYSELLRISNCFLRRPTQNPLLEPLLQLAVKSECRHEKVGEFESYAEISSFLDKYRFENEIISKKYLHSDDELFEVDAYEEIPKLYQGLSLERSIKIAHDLLVPQYGKVTNDLLVQFIIRGLYEEVSGSNSGYDSVCKKRINYKTKIYAINGHSPSQTNQMEFFLNDDVMTIKSDGDDPYFVLPNFKSNNRELFVKIEISTLEKTTLELYYTTVNMKLFGPLKRRRALSKGNNLLCFHLIADEVIAGIRLDPGDVEGTYVLHKFEVFA